jgi:uncharacterized protein YjiS (DUF1127 family)
MSTMTLHFNTVRRTSRWSQVTKSFAEWRRRARSRSELAALSHMDLHDIGVSQCEASYETSKPFWMS